MEWILFFALDFSVNPKESGKELIIPCLPRNKKLFPHGKEDEVNSLDQQAAEEIINGKF